MELKNLCKQPLKLKHNRIWRPFKGGKLLDEWQKVENPCDAHFGEEWVASIVRVNSEKIVSNEGLSIVVLDDGEEVFLKDVIDSSPKAFLGELHTQKYGNNTALLTKVLDSYSRLLIQVHPDRKYAKEILGSDFGKTEAWYIINARVIDGEEPYIMLGFKPGITRDIWKSMFEKQDIEGMRNALHRFNVKPGDVYIVNAGVPHAIGSGCFLIEVQEPTDYTMRVEKTSLSGVPFTDYECHLGAGFDKMLDCFKYDSYSSEEITEKYKLLPEVIREEEGGREISLISSKHTQYFSMNSIEVKNSMKSPKEDVFSVAVVISGNGKIIYTGGEMNIEQSDEIFLPAGLGDITWKSSNRSVLNIVRCYPGR